MFNLNGTRKNQIKTTLRYDMVWCTYVYTYIHRLKIKQPDDIKYW